LAKIRSHVVSRQSCARVAKQLELGAMLAERGGALPDDELERLVKNRKVIDYAATQHVDYKTELQEQLARRKRQVSYSVIEVEGPAHERRFTCAAVIDGQQVGEGAGRTKKDAEQEAARQALASLEAEAT
jgi:ribonuclease-3